MADAEVTPHPDDKALAERVVSEWLRTLPSWPPEKNGNSLPVLEGLIAQHTGPLRKAADYYSELASALQADLRTARADLAAKEAEWRDRETRWFECEGELKAKYEAGLAEVREFARDIRDNYDCDEDAHRHGMADVSCRCCKAAAFLKARPEIEAVGREGERCGNVKHGPTMPCNLPKGHAGDHQNVGPASGGVIGWFNEGDAPALVCKDCEEAPCICKSVAPPDAPADACVVTVGGKQYATVKDAPGVYAVCICKFGCVSCPCPCGHPVKDAPAGRHVCASWEFCRVCNPDAPAEKPSEPLDEADLYGPEDPPAPAEPVKGGSRIVQTLSGLALQTWDFGKPDPSASPGERHEFVAMRGNRKNSGACAVVTRNSAGEADGCLLPASAPVHAVAETHTYTGTAKLCYRVTGGVICNLPKDDPVHAVEPPAPETPSGKVGS